MRNLSLVYEEILLGFFIQGVSGNLYTMEEWASQETVNGILISTADVRFVVAITEFSNVRWGNTVDLSLPNVAFESEAALDYNGYENTQIIIDESEGDYAAQKANGYIFPNGERGYLGSGGEWKILLDNLDTINQYLDLVDGIKFERQDYISTSTEFSETHAWTATLSSGLVSRYKSNGQYLRPFSRL